MSPDRRRGPPAVTTSRALRVRLTAADLGADAATVCADVVARLAAAGAGLVLADVVGGEVPAAPDGSGCAAGAGVARHGATRVDLRTLDGLARLDLAVRRAGARLELVGAGADLRALLCFTGLADVLAGGPSGRVEVQGQPEDAEVVGTDEVGDAADPSVPDLEQVDGPGVEEPGGRAGLVLGEAP